MPTSQTGRFKRQTLRPSSVLHVAQPVEGGVPIYVSRLAKAQSALGYSVVVASPRSEYSAGLPDGLGWVEWSARRAPGPWTVSEVNALRGIVRDVVPDVLHLHSAKAGMAGRSFGSRPPTIFQPHGWSWDAVGGPARIAVRSWERFAAPRCNLLVCVSEEERARGEAAGLKAHWHVIENAVDTAAFPLQGAADKQAARAQVGLDGPLVVCVGPLRHQKGQDVLVAAWSQVTSAIPDACLVIVGDGPERQHLEASASRHIVFAGHQEDVLPWLAAADVVAVPSRWDGLSLSLLEAMSTGRSIVATDCPGVRRVLDGGGEVVAVGNQPALAAALIRRLKDPELIAEEGSAGRRRIETDFDWTQLLEKMDAAYASVVGSQP